MSKQVMQSRRGIFYVALLLLLGFSATRLIDVAHALYAVFLQSQLMALGPDTRGLHMWPYVVMQHGGISVLVVFVVAFIAGWLVNVRTALRVSVLLLPWAAESVYVGILLYGGVQAWLDTQSLSALPGWAVVPVGCAVGWLLGSRSRKQTGITGAA